jgi:hypothetical protein
VDSAGRRDSIPTGAFWSEFGGGMVVRPGSSVLPIVVKDDDD